MVALGGLCGAALMSWQAMRHPTLADVMVTTTPGVITIVARLRQPHAVAREAGIAVPTCDFDAAVLTPIRSTNQGPDRSGRAPNSAPSIRIVSCSEADGVSNQLNTSTLAEPAISNHHR